MSQMVAPAPEFIPSNPQTPSGPPPANSLPSDAYGKALNRLWVLREALSLKTTLDDQLPTFQHTIAVSVVGGPKAKLERIWALALSTAFGRYRQAGVTGVQSAELEGTWDITGKSVQVVLTYANSGMIGLGSSVLRQLANQPAATAALGGAAAVGAGLSLGGRATSEFIISGPTQETVGGNTLAWLEAENVLAAAATGAILGATGGYIIGGILSKLSVAAAAFGAAINLPRTLSTLGAVSLGAQGAATVSAGNALRRSLYPLPDTGRIITTAEKFDPNLQPPAPSGDGLSRTFPFIALVSNALTEPCYLPGSPPQKAPRKKYPKFLSVTDISTATTINRKIQSVGAAPANLKAYGDGTSEKWPDDGYPEAIPQKIEDLTGVTATGV